MRRSQRADDSTSQEIRYSEPVETIVFRYSGGETSCKITGLKQKQLQQQSTISSIYSNVFSTEFSQSSLARMVVWWRWRNRNLSFVSVSLRMDFY